MEYYSLMEYWGSLVRTFKDSEREYDQDGYASEQLAMAILDYARWTRFRQYKLFAEQRGEEFDAMMLTLEKKGHTMEAVKRFLYDDDLWKTTLELAER
jgi:hypothetical protein